jgi:hypothetical protein
LLRLSRAAVRDNREEGRLPVWAVWSSSMLVKQPLKPGKGLQRANMKDHLLVL